MRPFTMTSTTSARATVIALALCAVAACENTMSPAPDPIPGTPSTIDVAFCAGLVPNWVAFQDGDGAWTQGQPTVGGGKVTFQHTFTTDHAALATVRTFDGGLTLLSVQYGLPAELALFGDTNPSHCGPFTESPNTLQGTVAGLGPNDFAAINAGFGFRAIAGPQFPRSDSFTLDGLLGGPQEILATRTTRLLDGTSTLSGIILRRTPVLPDGATLPVLDFSSAEAFPPTVANVTINGLGPEGARSVTQLLTAHAQSEVSFVSNSQTAATRTFDAIPDAHLEPGDLQFLFVSANPTATHVLRSAAVYFHSPVDQTVTLGAPVRMPDLSTVATTPSLRLRARFTMQSDYSRMTSINYQQGQNTLVAVSMTQAYAALGAGYDLIVPELTAVSGFDAQWALHAGTPVSWIATRTGGTLGLGFDAVPTAGATVRTGSVFDTFTP
jgi:hypothetical protein